MERQMLLIKPLSGYRGLRDLSGVCLLMLALLPAAFAADPVATGKTAGDAGTEEQQKVEIPEEVASPRDALNSFLRYMEHVSEDTDNDEAWKRAFKTLELSESTGDERKGIALKLLGVFNGLGKIYPEKMAPGVDEVKDQKLTRFQFLPDNSYPAAQKLIEQAIADLGGVKPEAKIELVMTESGEWKFSKESLAAIGPIWAWIEKRGVKYGADITELSASERMRQEWIPEVLKGRFILGMELWQWAILLIALLAAIIVDQVSRFFLRPFVRGVMRRYIGEADPDNIRYTVRPMGLFIAAFVFWLLLKFITLTGMAMIVLVAATKVVMAFSGAWLAWALVDLVVTAVKRKVARVDRGFRNMLLELVRKAAKLLIFAFALIYAAASLDINIVPLLGGVGLAGLAISFAAQDLIRNLFGGVTVFMDQPFRPGDRILYQGYDGTIEEVGIRSTKVRTLNGHLVTIPNGGVTSEPVENVTVRPFIKRVLNVTITYDTSRKQVEQAVDIIRSILEEDGIREPIHQRVGSDEYPPRVYFNDFNAESLNILVIYWFIPPAYWDYLEHGQRVNLRIFDEFEKAGIEFAFPTHTVFLAGDPKRELAVRMLGDDLAGQV